MTLWVTPFLVVGTCTLCCIILIEFFWKNKCGGKGYSSCRAKKLVDYVDI